MHRLLFIIFLLILQINSKADNNLSIVLSVNNSLVTELDLAKEIKILKIINKNISPQSTNIKKIAMGNIINELIKQKEVEKEKISIDKIIIDSNFQRIITNIDKNNVLTDQDKTEIYKKIELDLKWNLLISQKFSWNVNVNIDEIDKKIADNKIKNEEEKFKLREKLIIETKEKKLNIYSKMYLEKIKKEYLIKYYQ